MTTAWWDDIWLNEAFATWMAREDPRPVEARVERADVARRGPELGAMGEDALVTARAIRQPIETRTTS